MFDLANFAANKQALNKALLEIELNLKNNFLTLQKLANKNHTRLVFLGGGILKGIAEESALKALELSAGEIATFFNTPLGFRHGPKSILNNQTITFILMNQEIYARQYDFDLLKELAAQNQTEQIVVIDAQNDLAVQNLSETILCPLSVKNDFLLSLNYIIQAQVYAFYKSLALSKTPDNP